MDGNGWQARKRAPDHWLRANHREWSPPQVITIAASALATAEDGGTRHDLDAWAARIDIRHKTAGQVGAAAGTWGRSAAQLAEQVDVWCAGQKCVWMLGHDLSVLLALTRLPVRLAGLGWEVTAHAAASDSPWIRMRKGGCTLTACDAWGWLRAPLPAVDRDLGGYRHASDITPGDAPPWARQAVGDCDLVATAMLEVMDWWDTRRLGNWTLTGSGCGWNAYRHMPGAELPLIVTDPAETGFDRRAVYGGRREAFSWGDLEGGPWQVLDFRSAYPSVAAAKDLPFARAGSFSSYAADAPTVCGHGHGIIAECVIRTDVPRFPVRSGGYVTYPVGEFATVLAGPEIAWARELGCLVSVGEGRLYRLTGHMRPWADWVLRTVNGQDDLVPQVCRRVAKHWSRAVIGKWAAHGWETRYYKSLGGDGWYHAHGWNAQRQAACHLTEVAGTATETIACGDGDNAFPAILAWVESWVRVFLGRAMEAIGLDKVVSCDTDGMIVSADAGWQAAIETLDQVPLELRRKEHVEQLRVIGPQHLIGDSIRKLSGVPRNAVEVSPGRWEAELAPRLAHQMSIITGRDPASYFRPRHSVTLPETVITGWRVPGGAVAPLAAVVCRQGGNHLTPPPSLAPLSAHPISQALHLEHVLTAPYVEGTECSLHSCRSSGTENVSGPSDPTTSSKQPPRKTSPPGTSAPRWRTTGARFAALMSRVSSGWTRTSSPTRATSKKCGPSSARSLSG